MLFIRRYVVLDLNTLGLKSEMTKSESLSYLVVPKNRKGGFIVQYP